MKPMYEVEFSYHGKGNDIPNLENLGRENRRLEQNIEINLLNHIFNRASFFITSRELKVSVKDQDEALVWDIFECMLPQFSSDIGFKGMKNEFTVTKSWKICQEEFLFVKQYIIIYHFPIFQSEKKYNCTFTYRLSTPFKTSNHEHQKWCLESFHIVLLLEKVDKAESGFAFNYGHEVNEDYAQTLILLLIELTTLFIVKTGLRVHMADSLLIKTINKADMATDFKMETPQIRKLKQRSYIKLIKAMIEKGVSATSLSGYNILHCCPFASHNDIWSLIEENFDISTLINSKNKAPDRSIYCTRSKIQEELTPLEYTLQSISCSTLVDNFYFKKKRQHVYNLVKHGANIHSDEVRINTRLCLYNSGRSDPVKQNIIQYDMLVYLYQAGLKLRTDHGIYKRDDCSYKILQGIEKVKLWKPFLEYLYYCLGMNFLDTTFHTNVTAEIAVYLETFSVRTLQHITAQVIRRNIFPNAVFSVQHLPVAESLKKLIIAEKPDELEINLQN